MKSVSNMVLGRTDQGGVSSLKCMHCCLKRHTDIELAMCVKLSNGDVRD